MIPAKLFRPSLLSASAAVLLSGVAVAQTNFGVDDEIEAVRNDAGIIAPDAIGRDAGVFRGKEMPADIDPAGEGNNVDTDPAAVGDPGGRDDRSGLSAEELGLSDAPSIAPGRLREMRTGRKMTVGDAPGNDPNASSGAPSDDGKMAKITIDYGNDGSVDRTEIVPAAVIDFALAEAARRSEENAAPRPPERSAASAAPTTGAGDTGRSATGNLNEEEPTDGLTIVDGLLGPTTRVTVGGTAVPYVVAEIQDLDGDGTSYAALLGREADVRDFAPREGYPITVRGRRGRLGDRDVVVAETVVAHDGRRMTLTPPNSIPLYYRGVATDVGKAPNSIGEGSIVIGRITLPGGEELPVDFGANSATETTFLQPGVPVEVLARRGDMSGEIGLIAEDVRPVVADSDAIVR